MTVDPEHLVTEHRSRFTAVSRAMAPPAAGSMTNLPNLPEQQTAASPQPDRTAVAARVVLWVLRNVMPTLATLATTYTMGWVFITGPTIQYTLNSSTSPVDVTVRCDSLADQLPGRYYADPGRNISVGVACAQQLTGRAAWFGGLAPLTFACWMWTFRRRDPHPHSARMLAARERLAGPARLGGKQ